MPADPSRTSVLAGTFWAAIPPGEHLVQCYSHEDAFIDSLEGYVGNGLRQGEGVVVIASATHLHELEKRLRKHWHDVDRARWEKRYLPLLAQEVLAGFMVDGMPDEALFERSVRALVAQVRGDGRKVRVFGEMVALLWSKRNYAATVELENLWAHVTRAEGVTLFCAYARSLFSGQPSTAMKGVCDLHTCVVPG